MTAMVLILIPLMALLTYCVYVYANDPEDSSMMLAMSTCHRA